MGAGFCRHRPGRQKGATIPDISTPEALKNALLRAKSISYADPLHGATAGTHFAKVLEKLDIADRIAERVTLLPFGVEVIQAVAEGRFEIGVSQSSEISLHLGVSLAGPLPSPYALQTPYGAALMEGAGEQARIFIDFLKTEEGGPRWPRRDSMEPGDFVQNPLDYQKYFSYPRGT